MKATAIYVPAARPCDSHCRLSAYDAQSRRTGIASGDYAASVGYANGKAATLGWQERTTSYTYRPGLNQLSGFTTPGTSTARTFEYDAQHRLTEIKLNGQLSTGYTLNEKDQRIRVESEDGSYWKFTYDGKSQVTAMERRRAGEEEQVTPGLYYGGFSYDEIGNWTESRRTGTTYYNLTSNILNQYTDVSTVWPMTTWNPTYDADGNMLTGIMGWSYGWNGENRLISAENGDTRLEFSYDYMGRRFEKKVYTANVLTKQEKFVYDGYKLIQVLDALNDNAVTMTFVWHPESTGLDTPFSMTYDGETYYYVTDGNKNVMSLIDVAGTKVAEYVYDPFGRPLSSSGELAEINPFRFSSEQYDDETGLVYYNYRYYSPELGRWISRDPIEEEGGVNLYAMVGNNPSNCWDHLGENVWVLYGSSSAKTGHMAVIIGPRSGRGIFSYFSFAPDGLTTYDRRTYDEILNYVQGTRDGHPYTHYLFYCTNETQDAEARRAAGRYRHYVYLQPNVCTNLAHDAVVATGKIFVIKHTPASTYNHNRNVADGYGGL